MTAAINQLGARGAGYLSHALSQLDAFRGRLRRVQAALPQQIFDAHVHNTPVGARPADYVGDSRHMMSSYSLWPIALAREIDSAIFGNREVAALRIPHVFALPSPEASALELLPEIAGDDRAAAYPLSFAAVDALLDDPRVGAVKRYPLDVSPRARRIRDYFPPWLTDACRIRSLPIVLHLPRPVTICFDDLRQFLRDTEGLRVILAHAGVSHSATKSLEPAFRHIAQYPDAYVDTSRVEDAEVVELALKTFGPSRVLFGSDSPLHLLTSIPVVDPSGKERLATDYEYHWAVPSEQAMWRHLIRGRAPSIVEQLTAIFEATDRLGLSNTELSGVFNDNARKLFNRDSAVTGGS